MSKYLPHPNWVGRKKSRTPLHCLMRAYHSLYPAARSVDHYLYSLRGFRYFSTEGCLSNQVCAH